MAVLTADRWLNASEKQRQAWERQGHVRPPGLNSTLRALNPNDTEVNRALGYDPNPKPRRAAPLSTGPDMDAVNAALAKNGFTQEKLLALGQVVDLKGVVKNARTTNDVVQAVLKADAYAQGAGQASVQAYREQIIAEAEDGMLSPAEAILRLQNTGGVNEHDERQAQILREFDDGGEWSQEEFANLVQHQAQLRQFDETMAANNAEAQARADAAAAEEARYAEVDAVLGRYAKHADDPLVSSAVMNLFASGEVPAPDAVEKTITDAVIRSRAETMALEAYQRDLAIHKQLVDAGAYGLDAQVDGAEATAPTVRPATDFLDAATKEIRPDAPEPVTAGVDKQLAEEAKLASDIEEIGVTHERARMAQDDEGNANKSAQARAFEAQLETTAGSGPVYTDGPENV